MTLFGIYTGYSKKNKIKISDKNKAKGDQVI